MSDPQSPAVTVVVPVFNGERFLERTIRSAAAQTYRPLDILVVNDGSTDATPAILARLEAEFGNLRVVTIPNGGVANARNLGIRQSTAHYIAFLDADDLWHPTKIAKQVAVMERRRGADDWAGCYTLFRTIDPEDRVVGRGLAHSVRGAFFPGHNILNHVGNGSSLLVRRQAALEVGGFEPSYAAQGMGGCEDWDFQLRLLQSYKLDVVREYLVGYRHHSDTMSSNHVDMARGLLAVCRRFATDPRLEPYVRRMAWSARNKAAMTHFLRAGNWRAALGALTQIARTDPLYLGHLALVRAPRLALSRLRKAAVALGRPDGTDRPRTFTEYAPDDGLPPLEQVPREFRHARLEQSNACFERRLRE